MHIVIFVFQTSYYLNRHFHLIAVKVLSTYLKQGTNHSKSVQPALFLGPKLSLLLGPNRFSAKDLHENQDEMVRVVAQEQQNSILSTLHQIFTPFLLRRVKTDVDLQIPPKKEVMVYCPMTQTQEEMYRAIIEKTITDLIPKSYEKDDVLPEKRHRTAVDYSVFLDDREFGNSDDKFEEHLTKLQEYRESLVTNVYFKSAY